MIAGQIGTPSLSLLSAAHHAVEGYSEALAYEVLPFNVKVSIVEPPIDAMYPSHLVSLIQCATKSNDFCPSPRCIQKYLSR